MAQSSAFEQEISWCRGLSQASKTSNVLSLSLPVILEAHDWKRSNARARTAKAKQFWHISSQAPENV